MTKQRDELVEIISNFDGNNIIETSYDAEPRLRDNAIEQIADKILESYVRKESLKCKKCGSTYE